MSRIIRNDPYLTREDTGADEGRTPAVQHYEKQNGSDGATSNTVFTLSKPYVTGSNTLVIYLNGQKAELLVSASDETEYEETNSSTVTFGASLLDTDVVEFMVYGTYFIQDTDIYVTKANQNNDSIIINGDFSLWQRGTSAAAAASATFLPDRFAYYKAGAVVHTISLSTDVPTEAESGHQSVNSFKSDVTTADASLAVGDYAMFQYIVEGYDFQRIAGDYATLSFWVKGTKTGIHCVSFRNNGAGRSYICEYTINTTATWEKKTCTVPFDDNLATSDFDNTAGLTIRWAMLAGSTFHSAGSDAWETGNFLSTSNQENAGDNTANDFRIAQVKLERGSDATPFVGRAIEQELALCQRYYEKSYNHTTDPGTATQVGAMRWFTTFTQTYKPVMFNTKKAGTPTVVVYSPQTGTSDAIYDYTAASDDSTDVSIANSGEQNFTVRDTSATADHLVGIQFTADAEL